MERFFESAQLLDEREGLKAAKKRFVRNDDKNTEVAERGFDGSFGLEDFTEHNIAHAEAEGGEVDIAEIFEQIVVASAPGDGAEFAGAIKDFEDDTGVISEATDDGVVAFYVILQAAMT